jgi:hypothetical protein
MVDSFCLRQCSEKSHWIQCWFDCVVLNNFGRQESLEHNKLSDRPIVTVCSGGSCKTAPLRIRHFEEHQRKARHRKTIPATLGPKFPENGPEPKFWPEFLLNFEPSCVEWRQATRPTARESQVAGAWARSNMLHQCFEKC